MNVKEKNNWVKHLDFIGINFVSLFISFVLAYYIKFFTLDFLTIDSWRTAIILMFLINIVVTLVTNPYGDIFRRPYYEDAVKLAFFTVYSFILVSVFFYIMKVGAVYSRITIVLTYVIYYFVSFLLLFARKRILLSGKSKGFINRKRKLFIIAKYEGIEETEKNVLASDMAEYDVVGFCFTDNGFSESLYRERDVVLNNQVADYIVTKNIDDVIITGNPSILSKDTYKKLVNNNVTIHLDLESLIGIEGDDQFISRIGVYKTASIGPYDFDGKHIVYLALKRVFDFLFGIIGCVFLLPLFFIVKLSYVFSGDFSSVFFSQTRVGQYGKLFKLYKFRTMKPNADKILEDLLKKEEYSKQWKLNQKLDNDPRITKIGKVLRKFSLDEFPQVINLVKGEMSLVGPRPLVDGELGFHDGLTLYNRVKPGITGWWACNGRSNIHYRERLELEYYYVKHCSLQLDLLCVVRTIAAVLKRDGAI